MLSASEPTLQNTDLQGHLGLEKGLPKAGHHSSPQEVEYPEGGWRAWSVVLGVYHLVIGGAILFVFCLFMLSLSHPQQYYQVLHLPYVFLTQGLGMGIASGGSSMGGAIHPIMLNNLFHGRAGFHVGVRASAGLCAGLLLIALLLMRTRLPPTPRKQGSTLQDVKTFHREPPYSATVLALFFILTALYFPIYFLQTRTIIDGLSSTFAFYTLVILNGVNTIGRVMPTLLIPPFGAFNVMIASITSLGILIFCLPAVKSIAGTVVFSAAYGFLSGSYAGVLSPMVASLAKNDSEIGARIGICFTFAGYSTFSRRFK
ncbi:hypothetical protein H0H92_005702 [Tricholoma furcatifolium]|nr:hypothetical protein H0H92_005702 [Tricholoma furcatifolium]